MGNNSNSILLIFVKNPEPGKVKTRLAKTIGPEKALKVYHKLLGITQKITSSLNCDRQVWYSRFIDEQDLWETGNYQKHLQNGANLGDRMRGAFQQAFADDYKKAVIIGSDCAELSPAIIEDAFRQLDGHDIVIGPSKDGGYYLLGMQSFYRDLFAGINWSTPVVYEQTVGRVKELDLSLYNLPTLNDIDNEQDMIDSALNLRDL